MRTMLERLVRPCSFRLSIRRSANLSLDLAKKPLERDSSCSSSYSSLSSSLSRKLMVASSVSMAESCQRGFICCEEPCETVDRRKSRYATKAAAATRLTKTQVEVHVAVQPAHRSRLYRMFLEKRRLFMLS